MFTLKIAEIAKNIGAELFGDEDVLVSDVTHDSRQTKKGSLFVAIQGLTLDGHRFINDVMRCGVSGIISELDVPEEFRGTWLKVADARKALAKTAAIVYQNPSEDCNLVGITGTNGKTTTAYLVLAIAKADNKKGAMLTTVEYCIGAESRPATLTTPEAPDTQRFLREAVSKNCEMVVMEASSQAIHLRRCDYLKIKVAIFTNLTRDHLDYHHTMENYFDVKKELFDGRLGAVPEVCIINIDDEWGARLTDELVEKSCKIVTFSQSGPADFTAENINVSLTAGTSFLMKTPKGKRQVSSPLVGKAHVYNMLAATAAAMELSYDMNSIERGLNMCSGAPGRFEKVLHDRDFAIIVDYAHSEDALLNTLKTAQNLTNRKVITVFGCGGDRDKTKRKPMGEIAGRNSDLVIITSDNPRTEDPLVIIEEIECGIKTTSCPYLINPDRREAIYQAVLHAKKNDVLIIAGKGHETYQVIGNNKFHFDDRRIATEAIEQLNG